MRSSLVLLLCAFMVPAFSLRAQDTWSDRTSVAGIGGILNDVAWGNNLFVSVGTNSTFGLIFSSPDGETWTNRTQSANIGGILNGVAYGDGGFVAVGTNTTFGLIASSTNGTTWTDHTSTANIGGILRAVAYGNGVWVAVGDNGGLGVIATSTNGITWTNRTTTANIAGILYGVTYADGKFVVVGTNGSLVTFATSTNGQSWTVHTTTNGIGGVAYHVTHDGTQFIATGDGTPSGGSTTAHILTSPDGSQWTSQTINVGIGGIGYGLASGGGTTVLVGRTSTVGIIATTLNGVDWTNLTTASQAPGDLYGVARGTERWVAVGTNQVNGVVMTSDAQTEGEGVSLFFDDVLELNSSGQIVTVNIVAGSAENWTVTEDASWISLTGASGTGNGQVMVIVQSNNSAQPRSATLNVGTDTLSVNQAGTALTTPNLSGFYDTNTNSISLSWNQITASEGYQIERRVGGDGEFSSFAELVGISPASTTDSGAQGGVIHSYRVRATSGELTSDWSNILSVTPPPDIPDDLAAVARNASQIELTWSDVSGETAYLVYRTANDEQFSQYLARVPADETRYIDSGLSPASLYRYNIEAESNILGRASAEASATTASETRSIVWSSAGSGSLGNYFGVAIGNGTTVAVGAAGRITTSTDPMTWTDQTPVTSERLRGIAFAQSQFVAVGENGEILTSQNGTTWNQESSPVSENLASVAFSQNLWVVVGEEGALLTSPNGSDWTEHTSPAEAGFVNVFAGGSKFVAVETTGRFLTSDDGLSWRETRANAPSDETEPFFWTRTAGAFGGSVYSVVGPNSYHSFGSDAESWSEQTGGTFNYWNAVAYGSNRFVAVGSNGRTGYSTTGQGYVSGDSQGSSLTAVAYGPSGFVAVGYRGLIVTSSDGSTWTTVQEVAGTDGSLSTIVAGDGQLVAFGETDFDGVILRNSFDGLGWIAQTFSVSGIDFVPRINDAIYSNNQYIAVGDEGIIVSSSDGENWTTRRIHDPGAFNDGHRGIAAGQNRLIAAGGANSLLRSLDAGQTWATIPDLAVPNQFTVWNLLYGPRWVGQFGGFGSQSVYYSDDSVTWSQARVLGLSGNISKVALGQLDGEPLFVGVGAQFNGSSPQAMVSWDGRNWNAGATTGIDGSVNTIAYGAGVFLAVGSDGSFVWASLDGAHWESAPDTFLPEEVSLNGGIRDIVYFQDRFYGVGSTGLIIELKVASSDVAQGPILEAANIEIVNTGSNYVLRWPSQLGLTYRVYQREQLGSGSWILVGSKISGTGGILTVNTSVPANKVTQFWVVESADQ